MKKLYVAILLLLAFSGISCSVYQTMVNVSRLKFKLGSVNNFQLNGVAVSGKSKIGDFSAADILKISTAVARGTLPVSFVLNVEAKNPNDGTGGYPKTNATLQSFPWKLYIDDKETISGNINSPVTVPGTGEIVDIPLRLNLDLVKFFKDKGYDSLIRLALNIGGYQKSQSSLSLMAQPTVATAIGNITYPNEIKIVHMEFTK